MQIATQIQCCTNNTVFLLVLFLTRKQKYHLYLPSHFPLFVKSSLIPGPLLVVLLWSHGLRTSGLHTTFCTLCWSPTQYGGSDLIPMYLVLVYPELQMVLFRWLEKTVTSLLDPLAGFLVLVMCSCWLHHVARSVSSEHPAGQPVRGFLRLGSHGHTPAPPHWWAIHSPQSLKHNPCLLSDSPALCHFQQLPMRYHLGQGAPVSDLRKDGKLMLGLQRK